jgi:hypothetical protein
VIPLAAAKRGCKSSHKNSLPEKDGREIERGRTVETALVKGDHRPEEKREKHVGRERMTDGRPVETSPVKTAGKEREREREALGGEMKKKFPPNLF